MTVKQIDAAPSYQAFHYQEIDDNKPEPRVSTRHLTMALWALNTAAAAACCYYYPTYTVGGALAGALVTRILGDKPISILHLSEKDIRTNQISLTSVNVVSALYTAVTAMTNPLGWGAIASTGLSAIVGFQGASEGIYPLLRKVFD